MDKVLKRRLLLGVTGGIAAYKVAELARLLIRNNVEVQVAMTAAATKFVTPATFQALTGNPVVTDLWDASFPNHMAHIELSRGADAIVIAPASADFMAKLANGSGDDLLSTACLARNCPLLVAPAMNREMWDNAATQRNVATLRADGITVLGPAAGDQACGEVGMGRMLEPMEIKLKPTEDILAHVAALANGPFCVGFAAESENLADYAQAKRARKKIPMIVANLVQHAIGKEENEVTIYDDAGAHPLARAPKSKIAHGILTHALALREAKNPNTNVKPLKQVL